MKSGTKQTEDMRGMFLEEAFDLLSNIESKINALNQNSEDNMALMDLYRYLHNFKGISGTAGLSVFESFFHAFENIVSLAQKKQLTLDRSAMDLMYEAYDRIEKGVSMVRENKEIGDLFKDLIGKFEELRSSCSSEVDIQNKARLKELFNQYGLEEFKPESLVFNKKDSKFYNVKIKLDPNIKLKTARLFVIIKNIADIGTIAKSVPDYINLLQGAFELEFSLLIQSSLPQKSIEERIYGCGEVEHVVIEEMDEDRVKESLKKEEKKKEIQREESAIESSSQISVVNIDLSVLDRLVELFGELLIKSKQLEAKVAHTTDSSTREILFMMQNYMVSLQDMILDMQLIPLSTMLRMYPRMVRSLAQRENKRVNFEYNHHDVKIDRKILSKLGTILNHLIRNAVYHGIEPESERKKQGKNSEGLIVLDSRIENNVLFISVSDDGKGVNPEIIAKKAREMGLYSQEELDDMTDEEIVNIIFQPNFSTAKEADLTSGRGLGLNIVKDLVESLGGSIEIDTAIGNGTMFTLQIPMHHTLIRALLIRLKSDIYCIPLDDIQNLMEISVDDIKIINDREYIIVPNAKQLLPLYRLSTIFRNIHDYNLNIQNVEDTSSMNSLNSKTMRVVHIKKGSKNYALEVDEFLKESEIVIKKIDDLPVEIKGISGAAILDDGAVSLIIDPFSLVN
jgi:two-component system chemotaxis sensor kinase CheA